MGWLPDFLKNLSSANYGMWNSPTPGLTPGGQIQAGEGGVDIPVQIGTPVYAIASGQVVGSGYWHDQAHGVVTTRVNVPGAGTQDLYYQHIQIDPSIHEGMTVVRGQKIGTIGPYNEIEMGFNALWGQPWGVNHPGPWVKDPRPWIQAILNGNGAAPDNTAGGGPADTPPVDPITAFWNNAAGQVKAWGEYIAIFVLALVLIIVGFILLSEQTAMKVARSVT